MVTSSKPPSQAEDPVMEPSPAPATGSLQSIVPACPQGLTITKGDFLKPDFTVDNFFIEVSVREGGASLDVLRDDLGIYLKVLRSSMIELINQDYADFVNLSTNLVGLDQGILKIREPLESLNTEITGAREELGSCLDKVKVKLARQERIRQEKEMLASLQQVSANTAKVERMLGTGVRAELTTDTAERIATDINQLNFVLWKMKDSKFIQQITPRVTAVCDALNTWLDDTCLDTIRDTRSGHVSNQLSRCLRIYATIDRVSNIEKLVREEIVKPQVEFCLSEAESVSSDNLGAVCSGLLRIIPEQLAGLVRLTSDTRKIVEGSVTGFSFLARSFWPELVEKFIASLSHVASPGNPDEFVKNYNIAMKFLEDFEMNLECEESFRMVRDSEHYSDFMQLWNLPVYFQIRFQEIAKPVESLMTATTLEKADSDQCRLKVTQAAMLSIEECFKPGVYLPSLSQRFLQLSLQIIARYKVWVEFCLKTFKEGPSKDMKRSETSKNLQSIEATSKKTSMSKSVSEKDLTAVATVSVLTIQMEDIINIFADISHLISVIPKLIVLPSSCSVDITPAVSAASSELSMMLPLISEEISANIATAPIKSVKSVADIPRMYRRTNRETPSKPCPYILNVIEAFTSFHSSQMRVAGARDLEAWLGVAGDLVIGQYLVQVQDVLANVTKMEESLRKLKKVRERGGVGAGGKDKGGGLSDDDKIRLQLYLDVTHLVRMLEGGALGDMSGVLEGENCAKIKTVVDEAVASFLSDLNL